MIEDESLLILGAGSACAYGFPLGSALTREIWESGGVADDEMAVLEGLGFQIGEVKHFRRVLRESQVPSIDRFLELNPKYEELGKTLIAMHLIRRERPDYLTVAAEDHWYRYLWNRISDSWESFEQNKLKIITFNYDRSLETYLATALSRTFDKPMSLALSKLKHLEILHIYGDLGEVGDLDLVNHLRQYLPESGVQNAVQVAASPI